MGKTFMVRRWPSWKPLHSIQRNDLCTRWRLVLLKPCMSSLPCITLPLIVLQAGTLLWHSGYLRLTSLMGMKDGKLPYLCLTSAILPPRKDGCLILHGPRALVFFWICSWVLERQDIYAHVRLQDTLGKSLYAGFQQGPIVESACYTCAGNYHTLMLGVN